MRFGIIKDKLGMYQVYTIGAKGQMIICGNWLSKEAAQDAVNKLSKENTNETVRNQQSN